MSAYGDSETESDDDDDEDMDNLDSVSVVAAQSCVKNNTKCSKTCVNDSDSGRGESPESYNSANNNRVNLRHANGVTKAPRPISAVPSEYSDISTSSCRSTTSEGDEEEPQIQENVNQQQPQQLLVSHEEEEEEETEDIRALKMARVHRIAQELLMTEELYVKVLHLIDQVFHFRVDQENRSHNLFTPDTIPQMFANIKSIYKFHAEFLLPQLQERIEKWEEGEEYQRIGDIIVKFSPFFKMYTEYVKNFDNAMQNINNMYQKNARFQSIMDEIHNMPECRNLSLQHHMLTPIQRIPRYELLLKDYIKKLPTDSPDRADSAKALHLVSTAAAHANDAMKRIEKFKKLLEVQESLGGGGVIDLVSPTRELIKEGKIVKISARSGDHQDRYLFLFSDLLLLCSSRLMASNKVISGIGGGGPAYRLRARFEVDNIQVLEGNNLVTANTFYIRDDHKSVELYTQTKEEKEEWLSCLVRTIKELYQRKSSLRVGRSMLRPLDAEIGRKQPILRKLDFATKCMECGHPFSMMRKKHNCRACGHVVCAKCSGQKYPLSFEDDRLCRVCKSCYQQLLLNKKNLESFTEPSEKQNAQDVNQSNQISDISTRSRGLLEVPACSPCIKNGYLVLKSLNSSLSSPGDVASPSSNKVTPITRFFALLPDYVLYSFKSRDDSHALTATPLPGFSVLTGSELEQDELVEDKLKTIKLMVEPSLISKQKTFQKIYYLSGPNKDEIISWYEVLKMASRAEDNMTDVKNSTGDS